MTAHAAVLQTFVGAFGVAVDDDGRLLRAHFLEDRDAAAFERLLVDEGHEVVRSPEACAQATEELGDYFAGRRRTFSLRIAPLEGTPFQQRVWAELLRIPFGETISYGELARRVEVTGGSRAVGRANHENPVPIVIPCHRVIGQDGTLTGFGGGLDAKRKLLDFERGQGSLF